MKILYQLVKREFLSPRMIHNEATPSLSEYELSQDLIDILNLIHYTNELKPNEFKTMLRDNPKQFIVHN